MSQDELLAQYQAAAREREMHLKAADRALVRMERIHCDLIGQLALATPKGEHIGYWTLGRKVEEVLGKVPNALWYVDHVMSQHPRFVRADKTSGMQGLAWTRID